MNPPMPKHQLSASEQKSFTKFFRLAKNECCNFADTGPGKIRGYCWMEPRRPLIADIRELQCSLLHNEHCQWFEQAVVPLNADLMREWHRIFGPKVKAVKAMTSDKRGRCQCGALFIGKSNRQKMCDDCAAKAQRKRQRDYWHRKKGSKSSDSTFRAKISQ